MKLIVGLGNYGDEYAYTFHNMGFLAVECLADRLSFKFDKRECDALLAVGFIGGEKIVLAKPLTYMNLSGVAVKQLLKKHGAAFSELCVIFDDVDITKGSVRVRARGSAGTHNGMRNIISELGTTEFARIRVGIGPVPEHVPIADYVLSTVPKSERRLLGDTLAAAADEAVKFIEGK